MARKFKKREIPCGTRPTTLLLIMCAVKGRATGDVFLLPITPRAPFGQASCVPSSACDPGRDDVGRVKCETVDNHLHKLFKFTEKGHGTGRKDDAPPNRPTLGTNPLGSFGSGVVIPVPPPPPRPL